MIQFDRVSKRYTTGQEALSGVSFHMSGGELSFLTGHSGAGKSTLLKLIMLMERPSGGQLMINGKNLGRLHTSQIPFYRRNVGVVFQNHQLLFDRTVYDNVALPLLVSGYRPQEVGRRVRAALDKVGLLSKEQQNPIALSGGEQQRVGIARAVVHKPKILLADEPTGNLDSANGDDVMRLLAELNAAGTTIAMVTHSQYCAEFANRIVRMLDGQVVTENVVRQFL